jgi:hypothetical protein
MHSSVVVPTVEAWRVCWSLYLTNRCRVVGEAVRDSLLMNVYPQVFEPTLLDSIGLLRPRLLCYDGVFSTSVRRGSRGVAQALHSTVSTHNIYMAVRLGAVISLTKGNDDPCDPLFAQTSMVVLIQEVSYVWAW